MKSVLFFVHDDAGQEARLQAALDTARAHEGLLTCLQVTPYSAYVYGDPFGGVYAMTIPLEELRKREADERRMIEERLAREGVSWDWRRVDGDFAQRIVGQSVLCDVVVLNRAVNAPGLDDPLPLVADVVLHARAPVLAVPPEPLGVNVSGPALVAWNGSAEAANALRASLPMLKLASAVDIVTIEEELSGFPSVDACTYLARHGISAELHQRAHGQQGVADVLLATASELGATYIVMGAYGRSRLREFVLGGVTRYMLGHSPVPLLLAH